MTPPWSAIAVLSQRRRGYDCFPVHCRVRHHRRDLRRNPRPAAMAWRWTWVRGRAVTRLQLLKLAKWIGISPVTNSQRDYNGHYHVVCSTDRRSDGCYMCGSICRLGVRLMNNPIPPLIELCPECQALPDDTLSDILEQARRRGKCRCWRNTDDDYDAYFDCRDCYTRHKLSEPCKR